MGLTIIFFKKPLFVIFIVIKCTFPKSFILNHFQWLYNHTVVCHRPPSPPQLFIWQTWNCTYEMNPPFSPTVGISLLLTGLRISLLEPLKRDSGTICPFVGCLFHLKILHLLLAMFQNTFSFMMKSISLSHPLCVRMAFYVFIHQLEFSVFGLL